MRLAMAYVCGCAAAASWSVESSALSLLLLVGACAGMGVLGVTHKWKN